ncbi:hypothetical protein ADUPG1_005426 [Aduncisulcus paluster]|uniref:Uncharacterized protein n=1 Tax=Aduncisulcus paluster TaxID=2918883 RepID=A0ABQ5KGY4_9EUKA|nr:hypothetical protein ADUPG1_005426 [Aduncisulcus paluster]
MSDKANSFLDTCTTGDCVYGIKGLFGPGNITISASPPAQISSNDDDPVLTDNNAAFYHSFYSYDAFEHSFPEYTIPEDEPVQSIFSHDSSILEVKDAPSIDSTISYIYLDSYKSPSPWSVNNCNQNDIDVVIPDSATLSYVSLGSYSYCPTNITLSDLQFGDASISLAANISTLSLKDSTIVACGIGAGSNISLNNVTMCGNIVSVNGSIVGSDISVMCEIPPETDSSVEKIGQTNDVSTNDDDISSSGASVVPLSSTLVNMTASTFIELSFTDLISDITHSPPKSISIASNDIGHLNSVSFDCTNWRGVRIHAHTRMDFSSVVLSDKIACLVPDPTSSDCTKRDVCGCIGECIDDSTLVDVNVMGKLQISLV